MLTTRRGFFGAIAGLAAGMALDPERALWVPAAKLISIPRVFPPTAAELVTIRQALRVIGVLVYNDAPRPVDTKAALQILRSKREQWRLHPYYRNAELEQMCLAGELLLHYGRPRLEKRHDEIGERLIGRTA